MLTRLNHMTLDNQKPLEKLVKSHETRDFLLDHFVILYSRFQTFPPAALTGPTAMFSLLISIMLYSVMLE